MKFTIAATLASFGPLVVALPGQMTEVPRAYGGGEGDGNGGGNTCYPYTYYITSSGWTEYPTTICKTESIPYTKTLTTYKTIETLVPSSYVTTIYTNVPSKTIQEVYSTSTGYRLTTQSSVSKIKSSWTSVGSKVSSTCKTGGGYGSGSW